MNNLSLNATLTKSPELSYSAKGNAYLSFSVAYNHSKEESSFFDVKAFGKTAEMVNQWFNKGDGINITGELKQESWDDKNGGGKRSKIVIIARNISFPRGKKGGGEATPSGRQSIERQAEDAFGPVEDFDSMDIPF